jgi:isopenicillin N synthase-like dioxygenase
MLQTCSNNFYPSTTHRVINPKIDNQSRYSVPFFVHARDDVILSDKHTAKSYLEERLKEIGLK